MTIHSNQPSINIRINRGTVTLMVKRQAVYTLNISQYSSDPIRAAKLEAKLWTDHALIWEK